MSVNAVRNGMSSLHQQCFSPALGLMDASCIPQWYTPFVCAVPDLFKEVLAELGGLPQIITQGNDCCILDEI